MLTKQELKDQDFSCRTQIARKGDLSLWCVVYPQEDEPNCLYYIYRHNIIICIFEKFDAALQEYNNEQ